MYANVLDPFTSVIYGIKDVKFNRIRYLLTTSLPPQNGCVSTGDVSLNLIGSRILPYGMRRYGVAKLFGRVFH